MGPRKKTPYDNIPSKPCNAHNSFLKLYNNRSTILNGTKTPYKTNKREFPKIGDRKKKYPK